MRSELLNDQKKLNYPEKYSSIKVEPIRELRDIKTIKKLLGNNLCNFCLFVFGINSNLWASNLLQITVGRFGTYKPVPSLSLNVTS